MKKDNYHYERLSEQLEHMDKKSMDKLKQNLRDSYLQLKDLNHRCLIDLSNVEKNDKRIFYFKPESVLLQDPEKQRQFRDNLIKKVASAPNIKQNPTLSEELTHEMNSTMIDLTEPDSVRIQLAQFYQRRLYNIQHKKYKLLLRWAHFALTSEYLDRIGHHGTFTYGRLQRPRTKGADDEISSSMYNENPRKDPLSCIRMDDFEIYLRQQSYEVKLFRTVEKFIARLKWLPHFKRYDMFKESHILIKVEQEKLYNQQREFEKRVRQRFDQSNMRKSDDLIVQMEEILQVDYNSAKIQSNQYFTKAPTSITNVMELQLIIQERAAEFKIFGDIELDEGHSFTYQVNIFFTTYFQRQIIKSQFSIYDATVRDMKDAYESNEEVDDDVGDLNEIQRRNLKSLMLIDFQMVDHFNSNQDQGNLFLLKKGKKINEQIPELKKNFQDIIVIRLKKCYWLHEVLLRPRVDETMRRQNAFFSFEYAPDLLLQSIQDFTEINDISSINTIYNDLTNIYNQVVQNQEKMIDDFEQIVKTSLVTDQQAKKLLDHFKEALKIHTQENKHLNRMKNEESSQEQKVLVSKNSILRVLPKHYIQSMYTLRHMKIRDTKTKLLYALNFFRAVQKRLTLDLREFVGREVVSQNVDSQPPQEAIYTGKSSQIISGNINYSFKQTDKTLDKNEPKIEPQLKDENDVEDNEHDEDQQFDKTNLLDVKKWKYNGQFHNHMLNTCPIIPQFHSTHGEPLQDKFTQQDFTDSKSTTKTHVTRKSSSYLTRMDFFKVNEESKEIFVIDDYGMYILYDCSLDDMVQLDKEILKIGTYFIKKNESQFDFKQYKFPLVERFQLMEDIVVSEFEFYYIKAKLVMVYLEAYEHICDPLEQQRMMQIIIDLISSRPRIDYQNSNYFMESYKAEIICYETHYRLMREVVDYQMKMEKKENQSMRDYLQMTYKIANQYVNKQWSDSNQEDIKKDVKTRQVIQGGMRFNDLQEIQEQLKEQQEQQRQSQDPSNKDDADNQQRESNVDKFAEILGLKNQTVEQMMKTQSRSDEITEEAMNQDANFIKTQEGYPVFIRDSNDSLSRVKFTDFSNEIGVLDFYESLTAIPKVVASIQIVFEEVVETCMPANQLQLISLNTIYLEKCFVEFKKCVAFAQDELIEYKGSQYIENDLIMTSPDKLMFLIKDMVGHLSRTYKKSLNPFFVSKLDFFTVHNFQFQDMLKEQMQTQLRLDVNFTRNFIETQLQSKGNQARFFPKLREDDRKVNVPPMLLVFCNLIEVIRLRELMITNLSETQVLTDFYMHLRDLVNRSNYKLLYQNQLIFETFAVSKEQINFVEDGSLTDVDIDLAINEYDSNLRSNLNFMNSESVQCLVLDGGVSELRAATTYQVLQKQLLIVAVKTNMKMMDQYMRAVAEIELFQQYRIKVENSIVDYKVFYRLNGTVNDELVASYRSKYSSNMTYELAEEFMQILPIKQHARAIVEKKFKQTINQLANLKEQYLDITSQVQQMPNYSIAWLMRDYKISLLFCLSNQICKQNMIEATKFECMQSTFEIKKLMNLLPKDIALFKLQENEMKDCFFQNMYYDKTTELEEQPYFTSIETGELQNILVLPSYKSLNKIQCYTQEEKKIIEDITCFDQVSKQLEYQLDQFKRNNIDHVNLKQKMRKVIIELKKHLNSDLKVVQEQIMIGKLRMLQKTLLDMFEMNFYLSKLQMHPLECLQMEIAAEKFLPFWQPQDTLLEDQLLTEVEDEGLGEKIMKKLIFEKRQKQSLNDEMEQLGKTVRSVFIRMISDIVTGTLQESLDYLQRYNQLTHYKIIAGILNVLNSFYLKNKSPKSLLDLHWGFREISSIDLISPVFSNGTVIHYTLIDPYQRQISHQMKQDYEQFNRTIKGLKCENELITGEFVLMEDLFYLATSQIPSSNYVGKSYSRQYKYLNVIQFFNLFRV
ncbi:UNKNOWN [Stylonychia lemnae]|uniref:DUF4549 domain-containing protein n=1 Tax=Stylonychia lemnae TaxID=5949 RepID=A0A078A0M7_STYLE|nr:UNKNOWN [Stylonychia lemnae]|eukprot:CDW75700.1 UNKNOWN [Stylonychia lemnae]